MNAKRLQDDFGARTKLSRTRTVVFAALMAAAVAATAQSTNLPAQLDYASFKIIADRNIFNQNRTPHEGAARPTRVADSFSLVGTLFYAGGDIAFFDGTSDEYRRALKVGGDIAGFKVTAVTLNSVTLSDGTNQTVLKITTQMRRADDGHWSVLAEPIAYSSAGSSSGTISGRTSSSRSHSYSSTRRNSTMMTSAMAANGQDNGLSAPGTEEPVAEMENNPPDASASSSGPNSALERLMQRRAQQEQQLRQGQ